MKTNFILCMALIAALLASPAWAGCGKWVIRDNTDYLSDPDFDLAVTSSTGSTATQNPDGTSINKSETKSKKAEESNKDVNDEKASGTDGISIDKAIDKKDPAIDLGGDWNVLLEMTIDGENKQRALDLILIQTNDRLQGYGTVLEGGEDLPAAFTGYISDDHVNLTVFLVDQKKEYRLDLAMVEDRLDGSYQIHENETLTGSGNATASRVGL